MANKRTRISGISEKIYRLLLYLYPKKYRREYGQLMMQLFRDIERDCHNNSFQVWSCIIPDLIISLGDEYLYSMNTFFSTISKNSKMLTLIVLSFMGGVLSFFILATVALTFDYNRPRNLNDMLFWAMPLALGLGLTIIHFFIVYKIVKNKKMPIKKDVIIGVIAFHLLGWIVVWLFGVMPILSLNIIIPLGILTLFITLWRVSFGYSKKITIGLAIITIALMAYSWSQSYKNIYCMKKGEEAKQNTPNVVLKATPEEQQTFGIQTVFPSFRTERECERNFNLWKALSD